MHGENILRGAGNEAVAELAYEQVRKLLTIQQTARFIESVASLRAAALTGIQLMRSMIVALAMPPPSHMVCRP